ncbi:MAG: hypothetical protein GX417_07195 [Clostridiales bacterium]|nr:hypothetical protein [Clostridiales bacterium]
MEKWDIVVVITALVALFASVITPIIKLNTSITKLTVTMELLSKNVSDMNCGNDKEHDEFRKTDEAHTRRLDNHELRIDGLEGKRTKRPTA